MNRLGGAARAELGEHVGAVHLNHAHAQLECARDDLVRRARDQQPQHLGFARGQARDLGRLVGAIRAIDCPARQGVVRRLDQREQVVTRERLLDKVEGARLDRADRALDVAVSADQHNREPLEKGGMGFQQIESRHLRNLQVEQQQARGWPGAFLSINPSGARQADRNLVRRRSARRTEEQNHPSLGETGTRPAAPHDQRTKSAYILGAIWHQEGNAAGLVLPFCNTDTMKLHFSRKQSPASERAGYPPCRG